MRIEWSISKKLGNFRPVLGYRVALEDHEKSLALPEVSIVSTIPVPEERNQRYCYPGTMERAEGYRPTSFYSLETPCHVGHPTPRTLVLPWREDNSYPEVERSFEMLRDALEAEIRRACESSPMDERGCVRASHEGKAFRAPDVAAARFLRLAREAAGA